MLKSIYQFLGFDYSIVKKLGKDHKRRLLHLSNAVLFTAFLSALLIALTLKTLFDYNNFVLFSVSIVWFILVAYIDRTIVSSRIKKGDYFSVIRIVILFGFIIVHSATLDLLFFEGDIKKVLDSDQQVLIDNIEAKYQLKFDNLNIEKEAIFSSSNSIQNEIKQSRKNVFSEIDNGNGSGRPGGFGKVAQEKYKLFKSDSVQLASLIDLNTKRIERKDSLINDLNDKRQIEIENLQSYDKSGIITRLGALHYIIFEKNNNGKSNLPQQLFYFAFLLIAGTVEALPLIVKIYYRDSIKAFHKLAKKRNKLNRNEEIYKITQKEYSKKIKHSWELEIINIFNKYERESEINSIKGQGEKKRTESLEKRFENILSADERARKKFSKKHRAKFVKRVIKPLFDDFINNDKINDSSAKQKKYQYEENF